MQLQPLYINKVYSDIIQPSEGGGGGVLPYKDSLQPASTLI